jgi:hypothetical protein
MTALAAFLDTLSPDQRAQFVATAKHPPNPRAAPLRRLIMP